MRCLGLCAGMARRLLGPGHSEQWPWHLAGVGRGMGLPGCRADSATTGRGFLVVVHDFSCVDAAGGTFD